MAENIDSDILIKTLLEYICTTHLSFLGILFKDCENSFKSPTTLIKYQNDRTMSMAILPEWNSLADYEINLSKKYKKRFQKIKASFGGLEYRELDINEIKSYSSKIYELHLQLLKKQPFVFAQINEQYFENLKATLGERFQVVSYFLEEKLIAFASYFVLEAELEVNYIGINYDYNESHSLYFNILFDSLEKAIILKKAKLELGRTSFIAKASLGAEAVLKNNYLFFKKHTFKWFVKLLFSKLAKAQIPDWEQRKPYKKVETDIEINIKFW